jgi:hypothetical protein
MSGETRVLELRISTEAMDVLDYFCDPEIDIRFEVEPALLAVAWITRWSIAPCTPGLTFLEGETLRPLTVTLDGAPLEQVITFAHKTQQPPEIIASAVVTARGAQIAWIRRNGRLGKGIHEPWPPRTGT